jgi:hypothetical protein
MPDTPSREERLNEVIAAYLETAEAGRAPGRAELLARHPDLAGDLAAFFAWHAWRPRTHRRTLAFVLVAVALAAAGVPAVLRYREGEHNRAAVGTPHLPGAFKH